MFLSHNGSTSVLSETTMGLFSALFLPVLCFALDSPTGQILYVLCFLQDEHSGVFASATLTPLSLPMHNLCIVISRPWSLAYLCTSGSRDHALLKLFMYFLDHNQNAGEFRVVPLAMLLQSLC